MFKQITAIAALSAAFALLAMGSTSAASKTSISKCQTIDAPGSYELTKNLVAADGDCLVVEADFVTIDLDGYAITGSGTGRGISVEGSPNPGITIKNGAVSGFARGVVLSVSRGCVVQGLHVFGNTGRGIVTGWGCLITDNVVANNGDHGIAAGQASVVTGNTMLYNGGFGIVALNGSTVIGNMAMFNDGVGIGASSGSTVKDNTSTVNGRGSLGGSGFKIGSGSTVSGNTARNNWDEGFRVECPSNVIGNTAAENGGANLVLLNSGCLSINNLAP